jgi:Flp pilus assembly pilin Flp
MADVLLLVLVLGVIAVSVAAYVSTIVGWWR